MSESNHDSNDGRPRNPARVSQPWEANPLSAKNAIAEGEAGPVADYLNDAAKLLVLLSTWLEAHEEQQGAQSNDSAPGSKDGGASEDWVASYDQVRRAIEIGDTGSLASFARELGSVLQLLHLRLDKKASAGRWLLTFERMPGRPLDPFEKARKRRGVGIALMEARSALGDPSRPNLPVKREALVQYVMDKTGLGRAQVYRQLRPSNPRPKR